MFTTTLLCPHCNQQLKIQIDDSGNAVILLDKNNEQHSPTRSELEKIGIELGVPYEETENKSIE